MSNDVGPVVASPTSYSRKDFERDVTYQDCVIIVMGTPGAGRTTFIHQLTEQPMRPPQPGMTLALDTTKIDYRWIQPTTWTKGNRLFLIDTPAIDSRLNYYLYRDLGQWIRGAIRKKVAFVGFVFVHDLMVDNVSYNGLALRRLFEPCASKKIPHKLVVATTKSRRIPEDEANVKQSFLEETHWKPLLDEGAKMFKLNEIGLQERNIVLDMLPEPRAPYKRFKQWTYNVDSALLRIRVPGLRYLAAM